MESASHQPTLKKFIPAVIWFFTVLVLLCLPSDDIPPVNDWFQKLYVDKWVHVFMFGLMAFLFIRPFGRAGFSGRKKMTTFILVGAAVCLWGLATEFIQKSFVASRNFELADWFADTLGSIIAVVFTSRYWK